jgi:hypothetical protein
VVGILDSYRIMYWGRTEMVVPTLAIIVLMTKVYAASRQDREHGPRTAHR